MKNKKLASSNKFGSKPWYHTHYSISSHIPWDRMPKSYIPPSNLSFDKNNELLTKYLEAQYYTDQELGIIFFIYFIFVSKNEIY